MQIIADRLSSYSIDSNHHIAWLFILTIIVFVFSIWTNDRHSSKLNRGGILHALSKRGVIGLPESWLFDGMAWQIFYVFLVSSWITYVFHESLPSVYFDSIMIHFVLVTIFMKYWFSFFFHYEHFFFALLNSFISFVFSMSLIVLLGLSSQWTSFLLFLPISIWSTICVLLTCFFLKKDSKSNQYFGSKTSMKSLGSVLKSSKRNGKRVNDSRSYEQVLNTS